MISKSRFTSAVLACLCLLLAPALAQAGGFRSKGSYGDLDISGRLRSTNIVRHNSIRQYNLIMQRNTGKLRLEWKWLQHGKAFGRNISWLERSDFFMQMRGVYDSIYQITPGSNEREDLRGAPLSPKDVDIGSIDNIQGLDRNRLTYQIQFREAYVDLRFKKLPLALRIGRQQIVWGETDGIRMLDRANPLDLSWHFFQELPPPGFGFDELRIPEFFVKGLWDLKNVGNLSQTFIEAYWNPGDWIPGKVSFLPRPWGVRLLDPIRNSQNTGVLQANNQNFCGAANTSPGTPNEKRGTCDSLMFGTRLLKQGNYKRNPLQNSQFGVRFHFITPGGFEWTLNYMYQRFSPDGSPAAFVRGVPINKKFNVTQFGAPATISSTDFCHGLANDPKNNSPFAALNGTPWAANQICLEAFSPYVHTVGASLNWFESEYTQTVWRLETIIDFGIPLYDGDKQVALFEQGGDTVPLFPGISNVNMWKGMIAFDRPTWIKWLNKKTTFFITGQLFWHHILNFKKRKCAIGDNPANGFISSANSDTPNQDDLCGDSATGQFLLPGESWGYIGGLDLPNINNPGPHGRDNVREWEVLTTLAVLGFYKGGTLVPALIYLMDPINSLSQELAMGFDWFVIPDFSVNLTTRLIWAGAPWNPYGGINNRDKSLASGKGLIFDPWFLAGGSRGRSETSLQLTYQF